MKTKLLNQLFIRIFQIIIYIVPLDLNFKTRKIRTFQYVTYMMILTGFMSCKKDPISLPLNTTSTVIDHFLWQKSIFPDAPDKYQLLNHPILNNEKVIFHNHNQNGYFAMNVHTGDMEWNNWGQLQTDYNNVEPIIYNDNFYLSRKDKVYQIDINTGEVKQQSSLSQSNEYMYSGINIKDDMLFFGIGENQSFDPSFNQWYKCPVEQLSTNATKSVWSPTKVDSNTIEARLGKPYFAKNKEGDDLMIFTISEKKEQTMGSLYAFNLITKSKEWYLQGIAPSGWNDMAIIDNDKIYLNMGEGVICININDGEKLWDYTVEEDDFLCGATGMYLHNDKIIAIGKLNHGFALDKNSGDLAWDIDDISVGGFGPAGFYNNHIIYNNSLGDMNTIDIESGNLKSYQLTQNNDRHSNLKLQPLVVTDDGVVITSDGYRVFAFLLEI